MPLTTPLSADRVAIVTPVYDDWESFGELLLRLDRVAADLAPARLEVIAVDDGSTRPMPDALVDGASLQHLARIDVVHLACNLGHQRAIAIGLAEADQRARYAATVVMDADGEDRPEDVARLLGMLHDAPSEAVVAQRGARSEGGVFRFFYVVYRLLFRVLTGRSIAFGNFCALPAAVVSRLVHMPELWNHLPAALMRSRLPLRSVAIDRGTRYHGKSRMNLVRLVVHGLSAVSVYGDFAFTRVLVFSVGLGAVTLAGIAVVVAIRVFTALAIPGWASYMVGSLLIVLMQALMLSAGAVFLLLNNRTMPAIVPRQIAGQYVRDTTALHARAPAQGARPLRQ